jgi:hypothetical protein
MMTVSEALSWFLSLSPELAMVTLCLGSFMAIATGFIAFDAIIRLVLRNVNS